MSDTLKSLQGLGQGMQSSATKISSGFQKPSSEALVKETAKGISDIGAGLSKSLPKEAQSTKEGTKIPAVELVKNILGKEVGKMGSGISTKLASAIFTTGAKDELATADVYGKTNSDVINQLTGLLKGGDLNQFGLGSGKSSIVTDLMKMVKVDAGKLSLDTKGWTDRLVSEMGSGSGLLNGLSDNLKGSLTQSLHITPSTYDKILVGVGNAYSSYRSGDLTTARGVFNLMGRVCGDTELFKTIDLGAQANLFTGLISQAISLGVPEAIDKLLESSKDPSVTRAALHNNIETAVNAGDLATVNLIAQKLGNGRVTSQVPLAVSKLLANYKIPAGKKETDYPALWLSFKATLDNISPTWMTVERDGVSISNLAAFSKASADARKVMQTDPTLRVATLIAGSYTSRNLLEAAQKQYPLLVA